MELNDRKVKLLWASPAETAVVLPDSVGSDGTVVLDSASVEAESDVEGAACVEISSEWL